MSKTILRKNIGHVVFQGIIVWRFPNLKKYADITTIVLPCKIIKTKRNPKPKNPLLDILLTNLKNNIDEKVIS